MKLDVLTNIGAAIIAYMPAVLSAALILAACLILSSMIVKALRKNGFSSFAVAAKFAIVSIAIFIILSQFNIAGEIVNTAFKLIMAALAVAFAIDGKDLAAKALKKFRREIQKKITNIFCSKNVKRGKAVNDLSFFVPF